MGLAMEPYTASTRSSAPVVVQTGTRELTTTYVNPANYSVSVDYLLTGGPVLGLAGGNAVSDIGETIKLANLSASPLPFHFYQYSYFNLFGVSFDTVLLGKNPRGLYNDALQQSFGGALTETVTTPGANHGEVAPVGMTLAKLNGGGPVTLDDFAGPFGPGAVTWAFEWDLDIAPGGSVIISKDKSLDAILIPEPSVPALLGVGVSALALRRRRS
jgi:hypothetical protein